MSEDMVNHPQAALRRHGWTVAESGCWEWNASRTNARGGYGQLRYGDRVVKAHRLAYEAWVGPTGGLHVLHKCDNPPCLNPDHLFLGTDADNSRDKHAKGRGGHGELRGDESPNSKITSADVVEIRRRLTEGETLTGLAREFGVTKQNIYRIREGRTWKHL